MKAAGYYQMMSFSGIVQFGHGMLNGTRYLSTNNMTKCDKILSDKVEKNIFKMWNKT